MLSWKLLIAVNLGECIDCVALVDCESLNYLEIVKV